MVDDIDLIYTIKRIYVNYMTLGVPDLLSNYMFIIIVFKLISFF